MGWFFMFLAKNFLADVTAITISEKVKKNNREIKGMIK